jgi:Icc-related predicted phosphoesterase
MPTLKILALTDEVVEAFQRPSIARRFADVDLVVSCGDLPYGYLDYVMTMLNKPTYYVLGNHDPDVVHTERGPEVARPLGAESLDRRCVVGPRGLLLAGLEGSIRYDRASAHQYTQGEMWARAARLVPQLAWNRIRRRRWLDVLVAHSPVFGVADGPDAPHVGFRALRAIVERFRPRVVLHGHRHVYVGEPPDLLLGETRVINVFPYRVVELSESGVRCLRA